jgi:aminoglycoside phosphotransferase
VPEKPLVDVERSESHVDSTYTLHTTMVDTYNSERRRFITADSPALGRKIVIKRSTTIAEATETKYDVGTPSSRSSRVRESIENEALAIAYVKEHTTIPVPNVVATYEDRGCFYLVEELVEGMMSGHDVPAEHQPFIREQLQGFVDQLRQCRSKKVSSFTGRPFFAARFSAVAEILVNATYSADPSGGLVLCHGDLAWHNLLVDPKTFQIVCVLDWEYAGFYPKEFRDYWPSPGGCYPMDDVKDYIEELDDVDEVIQALAKLAGASFPGAIGERTRVSGKEMGIADSVNNRGSAREITERYYDLVGNRPE